MQVLVRIDAANDATLDSFDDSHSQPPALIVNEQLRRGPNAWTGQSRDHVRSGPSRVTGIGEANPHRKAFPGGRQVRGRTRLVGRCVSQAAPSRLAAPAYQTVHRCESQTAQELALIH